MSDAATIDPELAARLTLFFLRASAPTHWTFRMDSFALARGGAPASVEETVRHLMAAPKPFCCYAELEGDLLVIQSRVPAWIAQMGRKHAEDRDDFHTQREREDYGDAWHEVKALCLGRHEWRIATLGELAAWHRAYPFIGEDGYSSTPYAPGDAAPDSLRGELPDDALQAARAQGVREIRSYWWAARDEGDVHEEHVALARVEPGTRPGLRCEQCREREARFTAEWLDDEHPPRHLCQRCADELLDHDFDEARDLDKLRAALSIAELASTRAELEEEAVELAMVWARHRPPAFIREFMARHHPG